MEEHLHGILHVTERLEQALGSIIASFKAQCTQSFREMLGTEGSLFSPGFQDSIFFHRGQLQRMFEYLKDNPRRLAVRRMFPDLFTKARILPFCNGFLSSYGNCDLLRSPRFYQVQVSRETSQNHEAMQCMREAMLAAAECNAVVVSPCISKGEQDLAHEALNLSIPLIVLRNNGFPHLFKPSGTYFDACAKGKLLMLAPVGFGITIGNKKLTRTEACILNALAQRICGNDAVPITYHGLVPKTWSTWWLGHWKRTPSPVFSNRVPAAPRGHPPAAQGAGKEGPTAPLWRRFSAARASSRG